MYIELTKQEQRILKALLENCLEGKLFIQEVADTLSTILQKLQYYNSKSKKQQEQCRK